MISFGAKLTVNDNIFSASMTKDGKSAVKKAVDEYTTFIKTAKINALTKNDEIEISKAKYQGGYALELKISNPQLESSFVTGIYSNGKGEHLKSSDLIWQTLLYLCFKTGEKPRFYENSLKYIDRVLFNGKLYNKS